MQAETKNCQNCKKDFTIEPKDFSFYEKIKVPLPTWCPECRFQRRLVVRNNRVFHKQECALCRKSMIALYKKGGPYTVYCYDCWFSDQWDVMSYGQEYDFSVPFFTQFATFQKSVPRASLYRDNFISSDYCNYGMDFKECYLSFGGAENERVHFSNQILSSKDSMDVSFSGKLEFCYEDFECSRSNRLFFSHHSTDCVESAYLIDCRNCMNCFGCVGLVNKQYYIFNQPHTKEEYQKFMVANQSSYQKHVENLAKLEELRTKMPHRYARNYQCVDSTGDDLSGCRNTHSSFTTRRTEDSKYLFYVQNGAKDCFDCCFQGWDSELAYEIAHGFNGSNVAFGMRSIHNRDAKYSEECKECANIFGCVGLRKKDYCILNKQYSKEEYEDLLSKIIQHMEEMPYTDSRGRIYKYGEFFPPDFSPFAYNETIAQEYFPLSLDEALAAGYRFEESEERNYKIDLKTQELPDNISEVKDEVVGKVIACGHALACKHQCTEVFKIVPEEMKFYKRMNLLLPRLCPNCKHYERIKLRNPLKLWERRCMCDRDDYFHGAEKCVIKFKTSYAPDRPEIVYCEKCYQQEVY